MTIESATVQEAKAAVKEFTAGGFVMEVGRKAGKLAMAAIHAVLIVGAVTVAADVLLPKDPMGPLSRSGYSQVVGKMQELADKEMKGKQVVVLDRSNSRNAEIKRIERKLKISNGEDVVQLLSSHMDAAMMGAKLSGNPLCIVAGNDTLSTPRIRFAMSGGVTNTGTITTVDSQMQSLFHELGHCYGFNEAEADAFAALMAIKYDLSADINQVLAATRQHTEFTTTIDTDDHFTSTTVEAIVQVEGTMRQSGVLKDASWDDIAAMAKRIAEATEYPDHVKELIKDLRVSLRYLTGVDGMWVAVKEGLVATTTDEWMRTSAVPYLYRIWELKEFLQGERNGNLMPAFRFDYAKSFAELQAAARAGDPSASMLVMDFARAGSKFPQPQEPIQTASLLSAENIWHADIVPYSNKEEIAAIRRYSGNLRIDRASPQKQVQGDDDVHVEQSGPRL